ncbi:MAG: LytTR family DNA-binding domain-containing protein [Flavobacteriaceae bacterium]|nr:LytTR family DNA-binding domain-containing protein [Flavobacteriaceae bacterium]
MRAVIIEDEQPAARRLKRMLESLELDVVCLLHSVKEAVTWLNSNDHPDLVFLDIQLSDGLSFEIFEQVDVKSAIIFTTAYDKYALKAFKFNSIDYLLKPIDDEELAHAISQYKNKSKSDLSAVQVDIEQLKKLLIKPTELTYKTRFTIKVGQHLKIIPVDDIVCFYSENKGTYIHTTQNRSYLIDDTLEQVQNQIDPLRFFRVNRTYTVNLKAIKDIVSFTNSRLKISLQHLNTVPIIVSREKVKDFKEWLA